MVTGVAALVIAGLVLVPAQMTRSVLSAALSGVLICTQVAPLSSDRHTPS